MSGKEKLKEHYADVAQQAADGCVVCDPYEAANAGEAVELYSANKEAIFSE